MIETKRQNGYAPLISTIFDDILDRNFSDFSPVIASKNATVPKVNIKETDQSFVIELAVPGFKKEDFRIELAQNHLIVSTEKKEEIENKEGKYTRKEFGYFSFKRSFQLPEDIESEKIEATYTDGILNLILPKVEKQEKNNYRLIEIG